MISMGKKQQRREVLLNLITEKGYVSLSETANALDVSEQTIRRDFQALEALPHIKRTHGGLALVQPIAEGEYSRRQQSATQEKTALAARVAKYIQDGASIFLDSGTTSEAIALALLSRNNLKVMTYSIRVASRFLDRSDMTVAIPAGIVRLEDGAIIGPYDDEFTNQFRFDIAVVAISGMDEGGRLSDNDLFEVKRVQAAMRQADKTLLLLTSDKVGAKGLFELCHLKDIDLLAAEEQTLTKLNGLLATTKIELL